MAFTKESVVDRIEVLERGIIQIRTANRILEDGKIISQTFHRGSINPCWYDDVHDIWEDTDISGEDAKVQAIANVNWTDEVKEAYKAGL